MFQSIDMLLDRFWALVVQKFCYATGRTNFFLARLLGGIGTAGIVISEFFKTVMYGEPPKAFGLLVILVVFVTTVGWLFSFIGDLEDGFENGQSTFNTELTDMSFVVAARLVFTAVGIGWLTRFTEPELIFRGIGDISLAGGFYCATHFNRKGKSLVRRALEALKSHLPSVSSRNPVPTH